jgi:hypothetical protein
MWCPWHSHPFSRYNMTSLYYFCITLNYVTLHNIALFFFCRASQSPRLCACPVCTTTPAISGTALSCLSCLSHRLPVLLSALNHGTGCVHARCERRRPRRLVMSMSSFTLAFVYLCVCLPRTFLFKHHALQHPTHRAFLFMVSKVFEFGDTLLVT